MKSLSNIIKGSALQLSNPKIIELAAIELRPSPLEGQPPELRQLEKDQQQLQDVQRESQKVLQETEAMIVDLLEIAREEARNIIAVAREEAEMVQIQASQAAQEMKEQALENGYQTGIEKAQQEMASRQAAVEQENHALLEAARAQKLQMMADCEADILRLSMAIASKVVAAELMSNPDVILHVIREAIALLDHPDNVTVQVNPIDLEHVLQEVEAGLYADSAQQLIKVAVFPDNRISSGGCTLESEVGMIDARLETRLEIMEQTLREVSCDD